MKKNDLEKALNNLLKASQVAKSASHNSDEINEKIRFQELSKMLSETRNNLIRTVLDYEDATMVISD